MNRRTGLLIAAWLACAGCGHQAADEVESETIVPVSVEPAATGSIRGSISVTGTITAAPEAEQIVIAPQAARILEIPKAEGDRVAAGDVLVRFELPALAADVAAKHADVARQQARLENARAAQTRVHDLFDRGVAARKEVEDADRELLDTQASLTEAQATLSAAETSATLATIRARFSGVVAKRYHNAGEMVEASAADPIIRIVDPKRLEVTANVPIRDVARIVVGAAGRLHNPAGDDEIALRVVSRPAAIDPGTAAAPIRLSFAAANVAPVGTPVQVRIDTEEHKNVVLVPAASVVREAGETAVVVAHGEKAERRVVTVGLEDEVHVEIKSGVKPGDKVIVKGQAGLPDGARITTEKPGADKPEAGEKADADSPKTAAPKQ